MPRSPRITSRHLHLQQRRFDVLAPAAAAVAVAEFIDKALLLRLRQQLLPLLLLLELAAIEMRETNTKVNNCINK